MASYLIYLAFQSIVLCIVSAVSTVCYRDIGCFSNGGAFDRLVPVTPFAPDIIETTFYLCTQGSTGYGQEVKAVKLGDLKTTWTNFKDRPTKVVVHGFLDVYGHVGWMEKMRDALLDHGDYNVIIVDWHGGNLPPYTTASANTRVVGAQLALLIEQLQTDFSVSPSEFHIIGHSLGSHIAGHAGERVPGLGRITGLDPAGLYFAGKDKVVRLDPTDADFVDVIHTDGSSILKLEWGTQQPLGHLDFYPNGGSKQPGCTKDFLKNWWNLGIFKGSISTFACSHLRAIKFFTESLSSKCPFMAFPCNSLKDYEANKCHSCTPGACASMGIDADQHKPPAGTPRKYYTTTADSSPFCQYHLFIKIKLAYHDRIDGERGYVKIKLYGTKGITDWITLDEDPHYHKPSTTYERQVAVPEVYGTLYLAEIQFDHEGTWKEPSSVNWGFRTPTINLHEVHITKEEQGKEIHLCAGGSAMENHKSVYVRKCKSKR